MFFSAINPAPWPVRPPYAPGMLRMSRLLVRTLREDPADAEVPSHRLLTRAGYIRWVAPGGYLWLPLGKLVLDQVARVIHEELFAPRPGPVRLLPGLPADPLPDPDQVPRRAPPTRRAAAGPGVPHEGLLLLRPHRRGVGRRIRRAPRGVPAHLRPARAALHAGGRDVRPDGRFGLGGVPGRDAGRRGHLRRLRGVRVRGQCGGGDHAGPAGGGP